MAGQVRHIGLMGQLVDVVAGLVHQIHQPAPFRGGLADRNDLRRVGQYAIAEECRGLHTRLIDLGEIGSMVGSGQPQADQVGQALGVGNDFSGHGRNLGRG